MNSVAAVRLGGSSTPGVKAVAIARHLGDPVLLGETLLHLASCIAETDIKEGEALFREGLSVVARSGDSLTAMHMHGNLGFMLLNYGRLGEAREEFEMVLASANAAIPGTRAGKGHLGNLGWVLLDEGKVDQAESNFALITRWARRTGDIDMSSFATLGLACCATARGDFDRAVTLHGGADAVREAFSGGTYDRLEQVRRDHDVDSLRARLGNRFDQLYHEGRTMTRAQALDFALRPAARSGTG